MSKRLHKVALFSLLPFIATACAPFVPSNYLGPMSIQTSQKINGRIVKPRIVPLSAETLNSSVGQTLLRPAMEPQPYRIGAFDNLNIIVWGHPDISTVGSGQLPGIISASSNLGDNISLAQSGIVGANNPAVLVQSDGTLFYPYVGHIIVAGLTINEAQNKITHRLSRYIRNPQVTVQVAKYRNRNIYVLGEVRKPGMQPLSDKPLSLMEAISNAGDINPMTADPSHIYLVRGDYVNPDVFWLNGQSPQSLMIAEQFPLQENDIVYISAASLTGLNSFISQILPSLSTYTIARGLANR